jgi:adenylate cyclase
VHVSVDDFRAWITSRDAWASDQATFATSLAQQLRALGLPVDWLNVALRTMHPEVLVLRTEWTEAGIAHRPVTYSPATASEFARSPIVVALDDPRGQTRVDLALPTDYPICQVLQERGYRGYLLQTLVGRQTELGSLVSVATASPGGFTAAHADALHAVSEGIALVVHLRAQQHASASLLRTYIGHRAADRVLAGDFRRLPPTPVDAIVWTCDLRGFTARTDTEDLADLLGALDLYFEAIADAVVERGGEVLKFIGDAMLGVFHLDRGDTATTAAVALEAAQDAFRRLERASRQLQDDGRSGLRMGFVLHAGPVIYGNIGSRKRLDFTVIGPAVNEAARMESLCKTLAPLLLSDRFVALLGRTDGLDDLGEHPLRDVSSSPRLFTPTAR